jgi:NAD-dependent SIR2 family protein deacetylase
LDVFDLGKPNTNHVLLAKLARAKYLKTICTTNFDQLIEKALQSERLVKGKDFQVFYKEDDLAYID